MKIEISAEAATWYKNEFDAVDSPFIKFYPRYGGNGHIPGFSLGVTPAKPQQQIASVEKDNLLFFIEEKDAWYFDGADLVINYNKKLDEPEISYPKKESS